MKPCLIWLALTILCAKAIAQPKGYVVHATISGGFEPGKEAKPVYEVTYISGEKLRYEFRDLVVIADTKRDEVTVISQSRREYAIVKLERLRQIAEGMRRALEEQLRKLEERMKEAKPEEKQKLIQLLAMLAFLNQRFKSVVVKEAGMDKIAGYMCKRFQALGDGDLVAEFWFCEALKVMVNIKELMDVAFALTPVPAMVRQVYEAITERVSGLPMRQELYKPVRITRTVTKVESKPLKESLFAPPKDYAKVDFEKFIPGTK
ncbi:MAG: DUF4412 domain-containing protein [Armatimonadota bacterium]|nr:DUF4412 domain-containing protein [Armatimonadota bacterium]MCX7777364.1 DUF4412 domain-containing protein [Armatimonadota bacterium]MDW8025368.1 DUF4412 domain-containing protein [Armatimonadota bacterium]